MAIADLGPTEQWPWWIHSLVGYVAIVRNIYERSSMTGKDVPSRHIFWDKEKLDAYFDGDKAKKKKENN